MIAKLGTRIFRLRRFNNFEKCFILQIINIDNRRVVRSIITRVLWEETK
jgi:hypothetical protein